MLSLVNEGSHESLTQLTTNHTYNTTMILDRTQVASFELQRTEDEGVLHRSYRSDSVHKR